MNNVNVKLVLNIFLFSRPYLFKNKLTIIKRNVQSLGLRRTARVAHGLSVEPNSKLWK